MKAPANIRGKHRVLKLLLVLLLAGSNMAFSAHVSSHSATDSGLCSLCIHPGGTDKVTTHEPVVFVVTSTALNLTPANASAYFLPILLHIHQSRAPPSLA